MSAEIVAGALAVARAKSALRFYTPTCTVKCQGVPIFRSQTARDLGCLLDLNPSVVRWLCMPPAIKVGEVLHVADFLVVDDDHLSWLFDAPDRDVTCDPGSLLASALENGLRYRRVRSEEVYDGFRLRNAKDLLRYGAHRATLDDRLRLLAALDEHGTLTVSDCLRTIRESNPTAALASMVLQGILEVELDCALIGPTTMVKRMCL